MISAIGDGEEQGWHFDSNDYVISLLLQAPQRGGEFEFVPMIQQENVAAVARVLDGTSDAVISVALEPGTLVLFHGNQSLHRVAPVQGERERLIVLLSYDSHPGTVFSDEVSMSAVGRMAAPAA